MEVLIILAVAIFAFVVLKKLPSSKQVSTEEEEYINKKIVSERTFMSAEEVWNRTEFRKVLLKHGFYHETIEDLLRKVDEKKMDENNNEYNIESPSMQLPKVSNNELEIEFEMDELDERTSFVGARDARKIVRALAPILSIEYE